MKKNKKKKIVFICNNFPNLSETFIRNQIDFFIQEGFSVTIFAAGKLIKNDLLLQYPNTTGYYSNVRKILLFPVYFLKYLFVNPLALVDSLNFFIYGRDASFLKTFYAMVLLSEQKADIFICHFGRSGNVGAFLKKNFFRNSKLLCMFHGRDIREGIQRGGAIYKPLFQYADKILSISSYNYKYLNTWGAPNIVSHPVGIDTTFFQKKSSSIKGKSKKSLRILTVGRLVKEKGYTYALEAIAKLRDSLSSQKFVYEIVGEGPLHSDLVSIIKENKLEDHVLLHGAKSKKEILEYYQKADIFLLPSVAEALPVVIMEAMACEIPVIATDVGSVREEVINGQNGFLIESANSEAIFQKLNLLVKDEDLRKNFGKLGRKLVLDKYDIVKLNRKLLNLINS